MLFDQLRIAQILSMARAGLARCLRSSTGSTVPMFAIALPAMLAVGGVAMDFAQMSYKRTDLQSAVDAAAIAAAKELTLVHGETAKLEVIAKAYVDGQFPSGRRDIQTKVLHSDSNSITVEVRESWKPTFGHFLSANVTPVVATATAALAGSTNICVLALQRSSILALKMGADSKITAGGCAVYSNSTNKAGVVLDDTASIETNLMCSAGGAIYGKDKIKPEPTLDCPQVDDPLAGRPKPAVAKMACTYTDLIVNKGETKTVKGKDVVFCGGVVIKLGGSLVLENGDFEFRNGPLKAVGAGTLKGKDVALYFSGPGAVMSIIGNTEIDLSGRESGPLAGMLIVEDDKTPSAQDHIIASSLTKNLTGTIYLPRGDLIIRPKADFAEQSAFTAIVANTIEIGDGPNVVLNTNYDLTTVPFPDNLNAPSGGVILTR